MTIKDDHGRGTQNKTNDSASYIEAAAISKSQAQTHMKAEYVKFSQ